MIGCIWGDPPPWSWLVRMFEFDWSFHKQICSAQVQYLGALVDADGQDGVKDVCSNKTEVQTCLWVDKKWYLLQLKSYTSATK